MRSIITETINHFVKDHIRQGTFRTVWNNPLVGFADARDPLFNELKRMVGPSHAMPEDLLTNARTVIVYFLPFTKETALANKEGRFASKTWAIAYVETNQLIEEINNCLAAVLHGKGLRSVSVPPTHNFDREHLISDWSHKHAAYIAGLGTFGTHCLLITDKGCCGRLGSIITDAVITPTERPDSEYCLNRYNNSCGACITRCVAGALRHDGFDRHRCRAFLLKNAVIHLQEGSANVCGKCSVSVPCSFENPVKHVTDRNRGKY